jgi:hypothetical protein
MKFIAKLRGTSDGTLLLLAYGEMSVYKMGRQLGDQGTQPHKLRFTKGSQDDASEE